MTEKEDIKRLEQKIDNLAEGLRTILERQNAQYTDIMLQVKRVPAVQQTDDELCVAAKAEVIKAKKASTSFLQRKLSVGYARAAQLMDMLEEKGVIGPGSGAKPRDVLTKKKK